MHEGLGELGGAAPVTRQLGAINPLRILKNMEVLLEIRVRAGWHSARRPGLIVISLLGEVGGALLDR